MTDLISGAVSGQVPRTPRAAFAQRGETGVGRADAQCWDSLQAVCHDVATPAVTIRALAEVIGAEANLPPSVARSLELIVRETQNITDLCSYVLGRPARDGALDLDSSAGDAVRSARFVHRSAIDLDTEPAQVAAHPIPVRRLLANLIDNACRAAGPDGAVLVSVTQRGGEARLVVADSGPGPGAWCTGLGHGPRRRGRRSGFGLRNVADAVDECGGRIVVQRGSLGGAAVVVTFPAVGEAGGDEDVAEGHGIEFDHEACQEVQRTGVQA